MRRRGIQFRPRNRCRTGKIIYINAESAEMDMKAVGDPQPGANVYPCVRCGGWHWGHTSWSVSTPVLSEQRERQLRDDAELRQLIVRK